MNRVLLAAGGTVALLTMALYLSFGTLSPCGMLRVKVAKEANATGGLVGFIAGVLPDSALDAILEGMFGKLTPIRCIGVLLDPPARQPVAAQPPPVPATGSAGQTCNTPACQLAARAESESRQAFGACRAAAGMPQYAPVQRDEPCVGAALKAYLATGALPPYAHPCTAAGPVDHLGRCL